MWAAIFIIVLAIIMVLAAPKPNIENARAAKLGDFQFPRSKEGDPIPWILGTVRARSPVSLWYGDYQPVPIVKKQKTGMFSSKRVTVGYKYHMGLDLCWCMGDGVKLLRLWAGKHLFWEGSLSTVSDISIAKPTLFGGEEEQGGLRGKIRFYPGSFDADRDPYLVLKSDPDVPAYVGQCRTVFSGYTYQVPLNAVWIGTPIALAATISNSAFYFGNTTNLEPINAELQRLSSKLDVKYSIMPNGKDVNPMELLYVAMTERWGMLSIDESQIDKPSWIACAKTCYEENLGMSIIVQQPLTGKDLAEEALRIADGIMYQDPTTGKIVAKLIRKDYDMTTLPVLGMGIVKELTNFSKTTWEGTYNQARVKYRDRDHEYAEKVATAQDFANINFQQKIRNTDISMPGTYLNEAANKLAARQLSLLSVPLYSIEIRCNRKASKLKPGDVFKFEWEPYGITNMVMRVQKVDLGTLTDGTITIHAVQDVYAASVAVFAPPGGSGWVNPVGPPAAVVNPALFELPFEMSGVAGAIVATLASKTKSIEHGYNVYSGLESADAKLVKGAAVTDFTPTATLLNAFPVTTAAIDTAGFVVTAGYHLSDATGVVAQDQFYAGDSVALIRSSAGDELVAYRSFDGTTAEYVARGIYGTVPLSHPAGAKVYFLSYGFGEENPDEPYVVQPQTIYAKLLTYNGYGEMAKSAATLLNTTVVCKALRPAVPGKVRINGQHPLALTTQQSGTLVMAWAHRNKMLPTVITQDENSVTAESGTGYNIRVRRADNNELLTQSLNAQATSATITLAYTGQIIIEIEAVLNGLVSYSMHRYSINYSGAGNSAHVITPDTTTYVLDGGGA